MDRHLITFAFLALCCRGVNAQSEAQELPAFNAASPAGKKVTVCHFEGEDHKRDFVTNNSLHNRSLTPQCIKEEGQALEVSVQSCAEIHQAQARYARRKFLLFGKRTEINCDRGDLQAY